MRLKVIGGTGPIVERLKLPVARPWRLEWIGVGRFLHSAFVGEFLRNP